MNRGFCYDQSNGTLWLINGAYELPLGDGFAGNSHGRNNPDAEGIVATGPLPAGNYDMRVVVHPRFKAPAIKLDPWPETETYGRSGFYIHGGTISHGCIVVERGLRMAIASLMAIGFTRLKVVP